MPFAAILQLVGGGIQAFGTIKAGQEARRTGEINAELIRRDAALTVVQADQAIRDLRRDANLLRGTTVAFAIGQGTTTSGSAAAILADQAIQAAIDEARIGFNRDVQVESLQFQARETRRAGKIAEKQAKLAAIGQLLGGAGDFSTSGTGAFGITPSAGGP